MKSKERFKRQIAAIKKMVEPLEAIKELSDVVFDIGEEACQEREQIRSLTETNRKVLMGNGNQENSILYRLGQTVTSQDVMMKKLDSIEKKLVGDIDNPDESSIITRLCDVERVIKTINKLTWLIVSLFLTEFALLVWSLLTNFGGGG